MASGAEIAVELISAGAYSHYLCSVFYAYIEEPGEMINSVLFIVSGPFYIQSHNFPSRHFTFGFSSKSLHLDEGGKRFLLHSPGLTGEQGTVTFESMDKKGHYLRHIK